MSRRHRHVRSAALAPGAGRRLRHSQNFLNDPAVAAALVRVSEVGREDLVVEIGAGSGNLTAMLARKAGRVLAYEIDPEWSRRLHGRFANAARVRCVCADALRAEPPRSPFAVVANIPYAHSTATLRWCLNARELRSATLLVQREFARKHTGDYGRWTQLAIDSWPWFEWALAGRVSRAKFTPPPRVDSAILRLRRRDSPLLPPQSRRDWERTVALGFSGLGGSLRASLARDWPRRRVDAALRAAAVPSGATVGLVSGPQWVRLYRVLAH